jgi:undecaprenol kinase
MKKKQGFIHSIKNAINGIIQSIAGHRNIKIMLAIATIVVLLGFILHLNRFEWAIVWICIAMVLSLELMNTALETLLDHLHPEIHPEIGKAKDIAAAAVIIGSVGSGIVGLYIFITHIF